MTEHESPEIISERLKNLQDDVSAIRRFVEGDNGNPGLRVRIDRLEQFYRSAVWVLGTLFVAALGVIATKIH